MSNTRLYIKPAGRGVIATTTGSAIVQGTDTCFTVADVGKEISIRGAFGVLKRVVTSFTDAQTITLNDTAPFTASGLNYYLGWEELTLPDDCDLRLTYRAVDIRQPGKLQVSGSDTFRLPGDSNNNRIFGHLAESGVEGAYSSGLIAYARVEADGMEQFTGILQLVRVLAQGGNVAYELRLRGGAASLLLELSNLKLEDFDLSEYDHEYTKENQRNSWDTGIIQDGSAYVNFDAYGDPIGEGYVYPLIDYGYDAEGRTYAADRVFPAVYAKTYLDKIFAAAGYTYDSDFLNSARFRRLIIPAQPSMWRLSTEEVSERQFRARLTAGGETISFSTTGDVLSGEMPFTYTSAPYFDNTGGLDAGTGIWSVQHKGQHALYSNLYWALDIDNAGSELTLAADVQVQFTAVIYLNGTSISERQITLFIPSGTVLPAGTVTTLQPQELLDESTGSAFDSDFISISHEGYLSVADEVSVKIALTQTGFELPMDLSISHGSELYNKADAHIPYGSTPSMNLAIPQGVRAADFLESVFNMFNLHVELDKTRDRHFIIEPREEFYAGGEVNVWTDKLDSSRKKVITPTAAIALKSRLYTYRADTDLLNRQYSYVHLAAYGAMEVVNGNDFGGEEEKLELIFSPTLLNAPAYCPDLVVPCMKYNVNSPKPNIRILYYGGLKPCSKSWYYTEHGDVNIEYETMYPYAGLLDDPFENTFDLNFSTAVLFYGSGSARIISYTANDLYNLYHRQACEEIAHEEGKVLIAFFRLTAKDISELDFRNIIEIEGQRYRLNRILRYDPFGNSTTAVELVKVTPTAPFTPSAQEVNGGMGGVEVMVWKEECCNLI